MAKEDKKSNVERIAEATAKKVVSQMTNSQDDVNESELSLLARDEEAQTVGFDVFDHCEQKQKNEGVQIKYQIKKNGEVLCTKYHPYSWEKLQNEFKSGHYQVIAKHAVTNTFIRAQTASVLDPVSKKEEEEREFRFGAVTQPTPVVQPVQPQQQVPTFMEILAMMNGASERARAESREAAREQAATSQASTANFIEMMKLTQNQNQILFSELAKSQATSSQMMMESSNKMFERMNEKFEKIVEKITQSPSQTKPEIGIVEVLKLQESAQEKGFSMFKMMQELAEMKAEEKSDLLEEMRDSRDTGKKSMTDTLIETVLPTVAQALSGNNQRQAVAPQPRRALPPARKIPVQSSGGQIRPRNIAAQAPQNSAQTSQQGEVDYWPDGRVVGSAVENSVATKFGLPTLGSTDSHTSLTIGQSEERVVKAVDIKEKIENILVPVVGESLMAAQHPNAAAPRILTVLKENGINDKIFLQSFSEVDILNLVTKYNLPIEATEWFKETYANIKTSARNELGGIASNEDGETVKRLEVQS